MNDLKTEEKSLELLYAEADKMPEIFRPSKFWSDENERHRTKLIESDLSNFKRSINVRYFSWRTLGIIRHQMQPIIKGVLSGNFAPFYKSKFINPRLAGIKKITNFNPLAAFIYKTYVAYLYEFVKKEDRLNLLGKIPEPSFGNPFLVEYKGAIISQDLCNSIHEFYSVTNPANFAQDPVNIAELGAGYGRTAYVFLKALPKASYCIIDIPPALYVSQEYLPKVFPNEKIFKFRPWSDFESVKDEFNAARIRFLLPSQIELLPPGFFGLFINISSLHEMSREQIANYISQIDRVCSGYFYTKQWRRSRVKDNGHIRMGEYPRPERWQEVYKHSRHPIQRMFFDALYKIL
jgi:putative sugar O-methyltransferase